MLNTCYCALLGTLGAISIVSGEDLVFPSSCSGLEDGIHTLKLMDGDLEDAPLVLVRCSNEYIILDVSRDADLKSYFDTFMKFHHSVAGPTNDVHTNWEGWYKPDDGNTQYMISPDCNICDGDSDWQQHKTETKIMVRKDDNDHLTLHKHSEVEMIEKTSYKTAYMMTGTII